MELLCSNGYFGLERTQSGSVAQTITVDVYAASHRAVREMKTDGLLPEVMEVRSSKHLNNLIEQDIATSSPEPMSCSASSVFRSAPITRAGIELMHRIRKGNSIS